MMHSNNQRQKKINDAATISLLARAAAILINLASIPIIMSALGVGDFAIWSAITSLLTMMQFLDFGVGNSAMGKITEAIAHDDTDLVVKLIRHAYLILITLAVFVFVITILLYATNVLSLLMKSTGTFLIGQIDIITSFILCYTVLIPATFVQRLLFAHQKSGLASVLQLIIALLYFFFSYFISLNMPLLSYFVMGYIGIMIIVYGFYSYYFIKKNYPSLSVRGLFELKIFKNLLNGALIFFVLQLTVAMVYNSDNIILTAAVRPDEVVIYATTWRIFSLVVMVNGLMLGPLWPAIIDAKAKEDHSWLKNAYFKGLKRCMQISSLMAVLLIISTNFILEIWTGSRVQAPLLLLIMFGLWVILEGYGQCMAMLLNGMNILKIQLVVALSLLIFGTFLKIWLTDELGLYGPIIGTIIAFVLIVGISETIFIKRLLG